MAYVVTGSHPVSLPGGRMAGPGEEVTNVKANDPHIAALVDAGSLRKKRAAKPKATPSPQPEEPVTVPETNETETQ
jgi:hypothetical protein